MVISPPELVIEGTDVTFECNATSRPAPNLLTLTGPDGNILKFNKITENRMMLRWTMSDIRSNEMGNYTCTADNNVANETVSSWLNILCMYKFINNCFALEICLRIDCICSLIDYK